MLMEDARTIYVFRNGTGVYSGESMSESEAVEMMRTWGPVEVGTPSGDFHVAAVESPVSGFAVRYHHPQIVSVAPRSEYPPDWSKVLAGSMIRLSRDMDSRDLHVVARSR